MLVAEEKSFQVRLPGDLTDRWEELLESRKIGQNKAAIQVIRWLVDQPEAVQLIVLGQVTPSDDVIRMALKQMGEPTPQVGMPFKRAAKHRE